MTDPARAQTVDTDIARHCAYSFPAVAYTLGRKYWPCLKRLYETLAADMQVHTQHVCPALCFLNRSAFLMSVCLINIVKSDIRYEVN